MHAATADTHAAGMRLPGMYPELRATATRCYAACSGLVSGPGRSGLGATADTHTATARRARRPAPTANRCHAPISVVGQARSLEVSSSSPAWACPIRGPPWDEGPIGPSSGPPL